MHRTHYDYHTLITDNGAPPEILAAIRATKVHVIEV